VGVVINVAIASHADPWLVSEGERLPRRYLSGEPA
jgi:hypothetical protein